MSAHKTYYPWYPLEKYIDNLFLREYDSNMPKAMKAFSFYEKNLLAHKNHPFLFFLNNFLFDVDCFISYYIIDKLRKPFFYFSNIKNKTHYISTGLKKGEWHNSSEKLFHGIFHAIIFYVNVEAKNEVDYYLQNKEVTDFPENQRNCIKTALAAKKWYETSYPDYLKQIEILYNSINPFISKHKNKKLKFSEQFAQFDIYNEERKIIFDKINNIEKQINLEKIIHMKAICDIHNDLWS